jgi:hypothetical protein
MSLNILISRIHNALYKLCDDTLVLVYKKIYEENTHEENIFYIITEKELSDSDKSKIRKYLRSYYASSQKDTLNICSNSMHTILFYAMTVILSWNIIVSYFYKIPPLYIFSIDMIIIIISYKLLMSFIAFTKKNSLPDYQAKYYYGKNEIPSSANEPRVKDKSIFITGFILILITFSFYTSSLSQG